MWCEQSQEPPVIAVYIRCASLQLDNCSRETQLRAIAEECQRRNLPPPICFFEDDECSTLGEEIT
jgi:hypothetical protein